MLISGLLGGGTWLLISYEWGVNCDFLIKLTICKGRTKKNFTVDKHKHNLSQLIKFNIHSDKPCWWYPRYNVLKMELDLCGLHLKTHNPSPIMRRTWDKSQLREVLQILYHYSFKLLSKIKSRIGKAWVEVTPNVMWYPILDPGTEKRH